MKIRLIKKMVKSGKIDGYKNRVSVSSRSYILSYKIIKVGKDYCCSQTTGKYRNKFTGLNLKELDKYIKDNMNYNCDSECWELN